MKRTVISGFMMRGGIDTDNINLTKKLVQLGECGHEMTGTPIYLVGKIKVCYACHYKKLQEQREVEQTPRLPFDRADADILTAARKVSQDAELTTGDMTRREYGEAQELGTRFTIVGGEVMELDSQLEGQYDEQNGDIDLPF